MPEQTGSNPHGLLDLGDTLITGTTDVGDRTVALTDPGPRLQFQVMKNRSPQPDATRINWNSAGKAMEYPSSLRFQITKDANGKLKVHVPPPSPTFWERLLDDDWLRPPPKVETTKVWFATTDGPPPPTFWERLLDDDWLG